VDEERRDDDYDAGSASDVSVTSLKRIRAAGEVGAW
jgi:hypothetical protein